MLKKLTQASTQLYYLNMIRRLRLHKSFPYAINYLKYRSSIKRERIDLNNYLPQIVGLLLIKKCNLSCDFCSASQLLSDGEDGKWKDSKANVQKIEKIFSHELFSKALLVDLLGGEPLLVKELPQIVSYFHATGRLTNLVTNGLLLKRKVLKLKEAGISSINISIYDDNLKILDRDLPEINTIFKVNTSLILFGTKLKESQDEFLELVRFVRDAGSRSLRVFIYRPMDPNPAMDDVIYNDNLEYAEFKSRAEALFPKFIVWPKISNSTSWSDRSCAQLWQRISVDMDGNLELCCGSEEQYANIFSSPTAEVYNHTKMIHMREKMLDKQSDPPEVCKSCNLLADPGW